MPGQCLTRLNLPTVGSFSLLTDNDDDVVGGVIRGNGFWEPRETLLLLNFLQPGDQVLDVGAHVGYFTIVASKLVGANGRVIAFEPGLDNFEMLKANCIINGCRNVSLERKGLLDVKGQGWLALSHDNTGDHRFGPTEGRAGHAAETVRFDEWSPAHGRIDFLKIDVQGCEIPALAGMAKTVLESAAGLLALIEISPRLSERAGYGLASLLDLFARLDAQAYSFAFTAGDLHLEPLEEAGLGSFWRDVVLADRDDAGDNFLLFFSVTALERFLGRLPADMKVCLGRPDDVQRRKACQIAAAP